MRTDFKLSQEQWQSLIRATKLATGYTPEQIRKISGQSGVITPPETPDAQLEADKILAIQRQNSKGFRCVDIVPQNIDRAENFCLYDQATISKYVGTENTGLGSNGSFVYYDNPNLQFNPSGQQIVPVPYWRTVFIPLVGNFLKIEYMHSQLDLCYAEVSLPASRTQRVENLSFPQNTNEETVFGEYYNANQVSSTRAFFIDFTSPSSEPIIAKHGDSFKTYFDGVYITFKQNSPRIRVTVGFNAEIISQDDRQKSLHMWDGYGLTTNSKIQPTPFCISDWNGPNPLVGAGGAGVVLNSGAGNTTNFCLIANPNTFTVNPIFAPRGSGYVWITDIECDIRTSPGGASFEFDVFWYVGDLGTEASNYVTGNTQLKNFHKSYIRQENANGIYNSGSLKLSEPIRVSLQAGQGLFCIAYCINSTVAAYGLKFSVTGYSMGYFQGRNIGLYSNSFPYICKTTFQDAIYPCDHDNSGGPT